MSMADTMSDSVSAPVPVLCLLGPTGAGKTAAALALAERFHGAVVNFDSRQVYADFPIITAQPTPGEQAACPHLLYGFLACDEAITAGEFAERVDAAVAAVRADNRLPILVGGTGLYLRAILERLAPIPKPPADLHHAVIAECHERGSAALHEELTGIDPDYASKIHPNDKQRICRALEVHRHTGHTFTWWHEQPVPGPAYRALKIGMDVSMADLEPRLAARIDLMLEAGAVQEARAALDRCPDADAPGWTGIGCAEMYQYLTRDITIGDIKDLWLRNTRAYAKRQFTWFKKESGVHWCAPDAVDEMTGLAETFLS